MIAEKRYVAQWLRTYYDGLWPAVFL